LEFVKLWFERLSTNQLLDIPHNRSGCIDRRNGEYPTKTKDGLFRTGFESSLPPHSVLTNCKQPMKGARMENTSQSEQTVSDLRNAYAAFNRGDIDDALTPLDPQIEWSEPAEFPGGGTYHGLAGVKRYLTQSRAGFEEGGSEPEQFIPAGNKIVVFVHARVRPKGSKEWHDFRLADVYTIRDGKAIEMRAFSDRQEA
jgi:ketosteroid isomerase-like protein